MDLEHFSCCQLKLHGCYAIVCVLHSSTLSMCERNDWNWNFEGSKLWIQSMSFQILIQYFCMGVCYGFFSLVWAKRLKITEYRPLFHICISHPHNVLLFFLLLFVLFLTLFSIYLIKFEYPHALPQKSIRIVAEEQCLK